MAEDNANAWRNVIAVPVHLALEAAKYAAQVGIHIAGDAKEAANTIGTQLGGKAGDVVENGGGLLGNAYKWAHENKVVQGIGEEVKQHSGGIAGVAGLIYLGNKYFGNHEADKNLQTQHHSLRERLIDTGLAVVFATMAAMEVMNLRDHKASHR